jgi:hypothetical protein
MFEENVNNIVRQTEDQLDILKEYITYRTTYYVERVLNRLKFIDSIGMTGWEITDSIPVEFSMLQEFYRKWGGDKKSVIAAIQMVIKELNYDIDILIKIKICYG